MSKLGTEEAEQIIRQYSDMIYRIAVHNLGNIADAEDILQDVCISLLTFSADKMSQATRFRTSEGVADSRYNQ